MLWLLLKPKLILSYPENMTWKLKIANSVSYFDKILSHWTDGNVDYTDLLTFRQGWGRS
jgi:hypothetical protein